MMKLILLIVALVVVSAVRDLSRLDRYSFEEFLSEHKIDIPSHEMDLRRGLFTQVCISLLALYQQPLVLLLTSLCS